MSDRVLPSLLVVQVVGEAFHNEAVDLQLVPLYRGWVELLLLATTLPGLVSSFVQGWMRWP